MQIQSSPIQDTEAVPGKDCVVIALLLLFPYLMGLGEA